MAMYSIEYHCSYRRELIIEPQQRTLSLFSSESEILMGSIKQDARNDWTLRPGVKESGSARTICVRHACCDASQKSFKILDGNDMAS
ncbi:uncharacterized protein N7484_005341 [Penicillium longicatenatum]|uniref:uncharacterized protein n=1 Tax=Penicillium longicatenatum TaxID=1561947 RepID=UPI002548A018|nr:uncharacterized protein N7484_005341 [Penicillium longicatenatum]KAJ5651618.1 hypothetical protein N7484_005341 [Penicillium longicatenatum]